MGVFVIAEAGVNHNGDLDMARELIDVAAAAGADAVKFQTFKASEVASAAAPKARYQQRATDPAETQRDMLARLELSPGEHHILMEHCRLRGIEFLSTPFDLPSLELLSGELGITTIKVPSGEVTNAPFLAAISKVAHKVILSTGMCTLEEVAAALAQLAYGFSGDPQVPTPHRLAQAMSCEQGRNALKERVTLLHCTSEYPAPASDANLRAMATMADAFALPVGYSDHTAGLHVALAAVALGAVLIEKHFTLDRALPGPDHAASLEPAQLHELVRQIHEVEACLGDGIKQPRPSEMTNRTIARRSIVAARDIEVGELLSEANLACKRPAVGVAPGQWWALLGHKAERRYAADEPIDPPQAKQPTA